MTPVYFPLATILPWFFVHSLPNKPADTVCLGWGDEKNLGPGNTIMVTRKPLQCPLSRAGAVCTGLVARSSFVCRTCPCNFHNAMCNRHGKAAPKRLFKQQLGLTVIARETQAIRQEYLNQLEHWSEELAPGELAEWVSSMNARDQRRFAFTGATGINRWIAKWPKKRALSLITALHRVGKRGRPDKLASFVKFEGAHSEPKKARAIQGYADLFDQAFLGPYVYSLQKAFCAHFNNRKVVVKGKTFFATIASGMDGAAMGDWMQNAREAGCSSWYERDGKNWDASVDKTDHIGLVRIYRKFFPSVVTEMMDKGGKRAVGVHLFRGLRGGVRNILIKTSVNYTTRSGHLDTTLRNSILNLVKTIQAFSLADVPCAHIIVMGDDMLTGSTCDIDGSAVSRYEAGLSMTPEWRVFSDWRATSFVSGVFAPTVGGRVAFLPSPGRMFARLLWTTNNVPGSEHFNHAAGCVRGLPQQLMAVPVFKAFFGRYLCGEDDTKVDERWAKKTHFLGVEGVLEPDWFGSRYGLSGDLLRMLEEFLLECPPRGLVSHPLLDTIVQKDLDDIAVRNLFV